MRGIHKESEVGILDTAASVHTENKEKVAPKGSIVVLLETHPGGCLHTDLENSFLCPSLNLYPFCVPFHTHMFGLVHRLFLSPWTPYNIPFAVTPLDSSFDTTVPFDFLTVR